MSRDISLADIKPVELLMGTSLVWKLLLDELCARDPNARTSLTANLDNMATPLRGGTFEVKRTFAPCSDGARPHP
jgi:hypothetical protein